MGGRLGALGAWLRSPQLRHPLPGCRGPFAGGAGPSPAWPASGRRRARGGERLEGMGGEGEVPCSPPLVPRRPPALAGARPGGSGPWKLAANGGGALFPRPPPPFGCQTLVKASARAPCSPRRGGGWGGPASAPGSGSGQRSAASGLRGSGPPSVLVAPALSPTGGGARPAAASYSGGLGVALRVGGGGALGGRPAALSPLHPLALIAQSSGARLLPCVVSCVAAGAAAAAGSAGGSASV